MTSGSLTGETCIAHKQVQFMVINFMTEMENDNERFLFTEFQSPLFHECRKDIHDWCETVMYAHPVMCERQNWGDALNGLIAGN